MTHQKMETSMRKVLVEVTNKGAVYIDDTRVTGRATKWGTHNIIFTSKVKIPVDQVRQLLSDNSYGDINLEPDYCAEFNI